MMKTITLNEAVNMRLRDHLTLKNKMVMYFEDNQGTLFKVVRYDEGFIPFDPDNFPPKPTRK